MAATETAAPPAEGLSSEEDIATYRDGFKYLLWFVKLETIAMLAGTVILLYTFINYIPQDSYFAVGVQGNREPLIPLAEPNMNKDALLAWVSAAATQVTTFGFDDYNQVFAAAQKNFSPEGWNSFQDALVASGLLKNVVGYQQLLTSIPISRPTILAEGLLEGQYRWIVSVVLVQTVRAGGEKKTRYLPVTMILVKMPTHDNPMGVGINTWIEAQ